MIKNLISGDNTQSILSECLYEVHTQGPVSSLTFEKLAYIKKFHPEEFANFENKFLSAIGLFYKVDQPKSIFEEFYSIYSNSIVDEVGQAFTATQASAFREIKNNRYFSFSAPTSSGKSHLFRELIKTTKKDILIIVPSRALIAEYYNEVIDIVDKDTLVLQFIEDVNSSKIDRRIFIVTPERGSEVLKYKDVFDIELVLLDEAQISDEDIRGMTFDALVRRVDKAFPEAKKVFAHPFISNPEAQLKKHTFDVDSFSKNYNLYTAGKIFLSIDKTSKLEYFSPNIKTLPEPIEGDLVEETINKGGSLLVYISKGKIYDGRHLVDFGKYIEMCPFLTDPAAKSLINKLKSFIGASDKPRNEKYSLLIDLMSRGIVIHHGSMPLKARLMAEEFVRKGYARICFATSTLVQGINMPFDIVWIDNFTSMKPIILKNLIGRSGRTSSTKGLFDYGYTIVKKENLDTFSKRFKEIVSLDDVSKLDLDIDNISVDQRDLAESIKEGTFDEDLHLPEIQVERIKEAQLNKEINYVLDKLLVGDKPITGYEYYGLSNSVRDRVKRNFKKIYSNHLRRTSLNKSEAAVLSTAIPIMLWHIQGKSFSEIVSLRYSFLSEKDKQRKIFSRLKRGEITAQEADDEIKKLKVRYSPIASSIPNSKLVGASLFGEYESVNNIDYDIVIYDTYDYLDKVISLSMSDPISAALEVYFEETKDVRAIYLQNYLKYGTNDDTEIWLIKYGFSFEDIDWLQEHVQSVDSSRIDFKPTIDQLSLEQKKAIARYL
ncbi:DEAD/DEAH box helicase [Vibrio vulnificus]|nr:DEAD/DEAH box helicase [Vibrio vulnificus]EHZ2720698.1 DEAD/DEAH box helicase [Vibrio vulnificus]EKA7337829.1 DEAD/DEAH box helicase [Vibrio vulnificus]ELG5188118.1 DEAD/DEAH box helicase [Vibrio vulnificus]EME0067490.1 DEAD/DEAH box helicase [Vibrio vulnificus]